MQIYSNTPLNLTAAGEVWHQPIPNENKSIWVVNKQPRIILNLGSLWACDSALEFSGSLQYSTDEALPAIIIGENDPLDTREVGLFLCKNESVKVVSGQPLFDSGGFSLDTYRTGEFGQMVVVQDGAVLALNCSTENPAHPPEFWRFDSAAFGWSLIQIWEAGVELKPL